MASAATPKSNESHADEKNAEVKSNATTAAEKKEANKQAEDNRKESAERAAAVATPSASAAIPVDDTAVTQPPFTQPSTHVDKDGVERITSGTDLDGWVPAPSDPHPSQVEAAKERNKKFEAEAKERADAVKKANA